MGSCVRVSCVEKYYAFNSISKLKGRNKNLKKKNLKEKESHMKW